jgi:S1-C subfamily serine protease
MPRKYSLATIGAALVLLALSVVVYADTLKLKDGTTLENAKVIPQGEKYWVKLADGTSRMIAKTDVESWTKGAAAVAPTPPAPAESSASAIGKSPGTATPNSATIAKPSMPGAALTGTSFAAAKSKADKVELPVLAVQIWEKYIDSKPSGDDLAAAKVELAKWQKLEKDKAEKINGKWLGGEEKKKLLKQVDELVKDAQKDLEGTQTVNGLKKLEDAIKLYPNSFAANFELGYFYLVKGAVGSNGQGNIGYMDKAIKSLETAAHILPTSAATWSNLAIGYNFRSRYIESVQAAYKAAKIEDSNDTVQNLVNSIAHAPSGMQHNNDKIKPIMEDAFILAHKHGIGTEGGTWIYVRPHAEGEHGGAPSEVAEEGRPGPAWRGSGFFVSEDGYIITNHHVATGDPKAPVKKNISFRVQLDDGTEKNAELIAIDEKADIALMKIKSDSPVPFLKIADGNPNQAAEALVLGYPATGEEDPTLQISKGAVKSIHPEGEYNVWFDLNTTHGNSGGPIVDKTCRVIGILTAGWQEYNMTIVGGIGPMQIKKFVDGLGDKAPKIQYEAASDGTFNGEKLTEQAKKATVLITAIRGEKSDANVTSVGDKKEGDTDKDKPASGEKPMP